MKIVVEVRGQEGVARPDGPLQVEAPKGKKSKF